MVTPAALPWVFTGRKGAAVALHFHGTRPLPPVAPLLPGTSPPPRPADRLRRGWGAKGEAAPGTLPPSPFSRSPPQPFLGRLRAAPGGGCREPGRQRPPSAAAPRSPGTGSRQRRRRPRPRAPRHAAISTAAPLPPQGRSGPGQRGAAEPPPGSPWVLPGGRSSSSSYLRVGNGTSENWLEC